MAGDMFGDTLYDTPLACKRSSHKVALKIGDPAKWLLSCTSKNTASRARFPFQENRHSPNSQKGQPVTTFLADRRTQVPYLACSAGVLTPPSYICSMQGAPFEVSRVRRRRRKASRSFGNGPGASNQCVEDQHAARPRLVDWDYLGLVVSCVYDITHMLILRVGQLIMPASGIWRSERSSV